MQVGGTSLGNVGEMRRQIGSCRAQMDFQWKRLRTELNGAAEQTL